MKTVEHILVPVDFLPKAQDVLEYAGLVAKATAAEITLLHVYEPPRALSGIVPGADGQRDLSVDQAQASALVAPMLEVLKGLGCTRVKMLVVEGFAVEAILRVAREGGCDLIVMATQGRTGFDRVIMGSVAEGVWSQAPCTVLTVHAPRPSE